jgi:15-hydroxyprostaglandin dehydrogenase (NAD)
MSHPVAIITGATSGIGLALTRHLLTNHSYKVILADITPPSIGLPLATSLGPNTLYHQCDVSIYSQQAALFERAFEWGGGRLDFFAANAGIDDRESLYREFDYGADGKGEEVEFEVNGKVVRGPKELDTRTLKVDLEAVVQGVWLFRWWNGRAKAKGGLGGGKVVATSSAAGF